MTDKPEPHYGILHVPDTLRFADVDFAEETFSGLTMAYPAESLELVVEKPRLEFVALMTGLSLVDLSIEYEEHLVRGEN